MKPTSSENNPRKCGGLGEQEILPDFVHLLHTFHPLISHYWTQDCYYNNYTLLLIFALICSIQKELAPKSCMNELQLD